MGEKRYEVEVKDVEYQQLGGTSWLARMYRPEGTGPFPTIVGVHGGAWNLGDRFRHADVYQALAAQGILIASIDFRQPPEASYPASVQDLNLAIRWLKVHAEEFGGTSRVGAFGASSGGHLVLLSGMRPSDPRYAALPLPGHPEIDASLAYVVSAWPVTDPLYRYQTAKRKGWDELIRCHDAYWITEDAMIDGSPPRLLERGESVETPPVLMVQQNGDKVHPIEMQNHFIDLYRKQGGQLELILYGAFPYPFVLSADMPDTLQVTEDVRRFITEHG